MVDKRQILGRLAGLPDVQLELGCGPHKRHPEALGVDLRDYPGVDLVGDVFEVLEQIPEQTVSAVYAYHFFEHVDDVERLLRELARTMKPGGRLVVVVPHFSNPYFYSDYTHRMAFGLYTFAYLAHQTLFARRVPQYASHFDFELKRVRLHFKSERPFYVRYGIKRVFQLLFNLNRYLMEFYEENLSHLIPCYELRFELERRPPGA